MRNSNAIIIGAIIVFLAGFSVGHSVATIHVIEEIDRLQAEIDSIKQSK